MLSVGNVFALEQEEWKSKDVVAVYVSDKDGSEVSGRITDSSHADQCSWGCVDDVLLVKHRKRMMSAVRKESISSPQHHDAMVHGGG